MKNFEENKRRTFVIKVHDYKDRQLTGTLCDLNGNEQIYFGSMLELITKVNDMLYGEDVSLTKEKVFSTAIKEGNFTMVAGEKPWLSDKLRIFGTFKLQICFKKHGTWQGILSCQDTGNYSAFRNALEMVMMMNAELEDLSSGLRPALAKEA
jgi:hypothetical protein